MTGRGTHLYLCNAIDEKTKAQRQVRTDSPAATNKVLSLSRALRSQGERPWVLSLGRGQQDASLNRHHSMVRRVDGIPVVYCAFWHIPFLTHLVTLLSAALLLLKLRFRCRGRLNLLVYNRSFHYLFALICARLCRVACFLDLEDGYIVEGRGRLRTLKNELTRKIFHYLCSAGAMVATSALELQLERKNALVCYGVAATDEMSVSKEWSSEPLKILFSGTLLGEAGAGLLIAALELLKRDFPKEASQLRFFVSGKGPYAEAFERYVPLSSGLLEFQGQVTRKAYLELLAGCHVGLSLRLRAFEMGGTTFPSKVIEYANHGLALLTTRSSDVPALFGDTALYLETETPQALAALLATLPEARPALSALAQAGQVQVRQKCSPAAVGAALKSMLNGADSK